MLASPIFVDATSPFQSRLIYRVKEDFNGKPTPKFIGSLEWNDLATASERRLYRELDKEKERYNRGEEEEDMVPESTVQEEVEKAEKVKARESRDQLIYAFYNHQNTSISQTALSDVMDISQQHISTVVNDQEYDVSQFDWLK